MSKISVILALLLMAVPATAGSVEAGERHTYKITDDTSAGRAVHSNDWLQALDRPNPLAMGVGDRPVALDVAKDLAAVVSDLEPPTRARVVDARRLNQTRATIPL